MASPIIAFLAGAGSGYLKQRGVEEDRQRQAEDQAFQNEQREAWRKQQTEADTLNTNLKNAQAAAEVVEGDVGDQSAGPPIPAPLRQQPAIAASQLGSTGLPAAQSAAAMSIAGQLGNQAPASAAPQVFRMVAPGGVNKTFNSVAEANAAAKEYSSPEAANARFVAAYRGAGQVDKALEVERNMTQGQAARMQLDDGIKARAAKDANARLMQAMGGGATGLQSFFDRSNLVNGAQVGFDTGKDGKVQFYTLDSEGKKSLMGAAVENTQEALSRAVMPYWQGLDAIQYMDILHRDAQAQRAQANSDRTFALSERKVNADISARNQQLSIASGKASGRAGAASGVDLFEGFDPQKALAQGQARAAKLAEDARANGKPLTTAQEAQIAQEYARELRGAVYQSNVQRQNEEYFAAMAKLAKTPEQVEAVRAAGLAQGMPAELMARIDSRLAPAPEKPAGAKTAPASKQPSIPKPTIAAKEVGGELPPAAASAGERLDKARADFAALRSSRAPSLKDGNAARAAHAQKIQAAQDALDAAEAEFQSAAAPYVAAAHVYRRQ